MIDDLKTPMLIKVWIAPWIVGQYVYLTGNSERYNSHWRRDSRDRVAVKGSSFFFCHCFLTPSFSAIWSVSSLIHWFMTCLLSVSNWYGTWGHRGQEYRLCLQRPQKSKTSKKIITKHSAKSIFKLVIQQNLLQHLLCVRHLLGPGDTMSNETDKARVPRSNGSDSH